MRSRHSPIAASDDYKSAAAMNSLDIEQQDDSQIDPLMATEPKTPTRAPSTKSQRIRAVRPEVINALSFLSVVLSLYEEAKLSFLKFFFLLTGIVILMIDFYFIYCEWNLKTSHAIPCLKNTKRSTQNLDDLLSDLPQCIWVLLYIWNYKFSLISMVCALHSGFSLMEDITKMNDT